MKRLIKNFILIPSVNASVRSFIKLLEWLNVRIIHSIKKYVPVSGNIFVKISGTMSIKLNGKGDDHFISKTYYYGLSEEKEMDLFTTLIKKSSTFYDIGANIGLYSLAASAVNNTLSIHSFEPDPFVYQRLCEGVLLNNRENINTYPIAIGDQNKDVKFFVPEGDVNTTTSSLFAAQLLGFYPSMNIKELSIEQKSLDFFCYDSKNPAPDIIKLDVECNELSAFNGMRKILQNQKPIILAEIFNDRVKLKQNPNLKMELVQDYTLKIEQLLKKYNYYFYRIDRAGILETNSLLTSSDTFNYLLTTKKGKQNFYLWSEINDFVDEIYN